jgi:hypothetical protein
VRCCTVARISRPKSVRSLQWRTPLTSQKASSIL